MRRVAVAIWDSRRRSDSMVPARSGLMRGGIGGAPPGNSFSEAGARAVGLDGPGQVDHDEGGHRGLLAEEFVSDSRSVARSAVRTLAVRRPPRTAVGHGRSCAGTSSQLKIAKYRHVAAQAAFPLLAEADGNRTRLTEMLGHVGFEDRGEHQLPERLPGDAPPEQDGARPAAFSIAQRVRPATGGSCRPPSHTRPSCSRTPVTMW